MSRHRIEYEFYLQLRACWSCRSRVVYDTWCKICMMDDHNDQLEKDLESLRKSTQSISARDIPAILYLINKSENIHHTVGSIIPVPGYIGINRKIKGNRKKKKRGGEGRLRTSASACFTLLLKYWGKRTRSRNAPAIKVSPSWQTIYSNSELK